MSNGGWLWTLLGLYAIARLTQVFPNRIPFVVIIACHVLPALGFAFLHGAARYRTRGVMVYVLVCFLIGNLMENLSIGTGFPLGHYHFTEVMGPKLLQVPILLGLAYIGIGYVSWAVAGPLLRHPGVITRPLMAAFVMTCWDLSQEPIWSNLVHAWTWHDGGRYFGVPLTNFCGWLLTNYLIYQTFALWLRWTGVKPSPLSAGQAMVAPLFYAVCAAGNLIVLAAPAPAVVTDGAGVQWRVREILWASTLISIILMGSLAAIASVRARTADT